MGASPLAKLNGKNALASELYPLTFDDTVRDLADLLGSPSARSQLGDDGKILNRFAWRTGRPELDAKMMRLQALALHIARG